MNRAAEIGVLDLQGFQVAHLLLHDWIPLGISMTLEPFAPLIL
jgi:hypothetical protein